ncbi:MAG: hemerythrin domain-containing protein [Chloroflexi bacterium]|nr:hemerythrin domain-containing protein [Chloroflexota bacterium]
MDSGMRPTEILKKEHQDVLQKLDAMEEVIDHLDQKEKISAKLRDLTSFFNTDFWVHFAKEEEALFPEIERFIPRDAGPLGVMLAEHDDLRKTNTEVQKAVASYLNHADSDETRKTIGKFGTHFIGVLRDHIYKEDNILFHMADMHLDGTQDEKVLSLFSTIEKGGK